MSSTTRRSVTVLALAASLVLSASAALAHEERESQFPPGDGTVPELREHDEFTPHVVVCKPGSAAAVAAMTDADVKGFNQHLLDDHGCDFEHIQAAVYHVRDNGQPGTNIYVLPGTYREEPSHAPACTEDYDGGIVEYDLIVTCGEVINLVTIAGDDPEDADLACDNNLCDLQIMGTGERPEDTVLRGGFQADGDWIKHNGLKADRADGFVLSNMTFELFRENAVYVHETDGYLLDRVVTRYNDLYGILTFTSDHGVMQNCEAHHNGDSGLYPGSAADVNSDSDQTGPLDRWSIEIRNCKSHHNALGHSGTAGNSIYIHDSEFYANQTGIVVDSFVGGHPGMPQDHLWVRNNRIYANNSNYVKEFVHSGICDRPPAERGYEQGTVCPVFPVPAGTGVMIAGGNHDLVEDNLIYDNWRTGVMLFFVPAILRASPEDPGSILESANQFDTSNHNWFRDNHLAEHPEGWKQPNGTDFWWDDEGLGNCWQGNTSAAGDVTSNSEIGLPDCDSGGSMLPTGTAIKSAGLAPCAPYDREDNPDPPGCDWFDDPVQPAGREGPGTQPAPDPDEDDDPAPPPVDAAPAGPSLPTTGSGVALIVGGIALLGAAVRLGRRNRYGMVAAA
ncbi:MAG: right-handed parallel beta-helix repeat-containing protein [Actinobacteria bacterium]|nr:right-handed parallel beta-helix repeat-containing protein [Actinomycetota bacterium]